ncbi:MAG TPA: FtsX-like permease family protein, partial [Myxococcota bacterium]|nr:FtsX-like permease family protein [Myxococcota bacterium]
SATTVAVRSRTVELGTLRALGISPAQLVGMVLLETALLAVMAVGLGAAVGLVIVAAVNGAGVTLANSTARYLLFGDTLHMAVSYGHLFFVLFLMVCITVAAALYPAAQAARIGPTDAMRDTF